MFREVQVEIPRPRRRTDLAGRADYYALRTTLLRFLGEHAQPTPITASSVPGVNVEGSGLPSFDSNKIGVTQ